MTDVNCALCDCQIETVEFDLKKSHTLYSKTPLLSLLQDSIEEQMTVSSFEICKMCYLLLNELDSIKIRAKAIETQLKNYLKKPPSRDKSEECTICLKKTTPEAFKTHLKTEHPELNELETNFDFDEVDSISDINPSLGDILEDDRDKERPKKSPKKKSSNGEVSFLKPFKCGECGKSWRTLTELKSHVKSHSSERPFICEICGQAYKRQKALTIHVGMHNGINPFTCLYCKKSFTQKGALVRHIPIHTGELPYQCDSCGKRFKHHTSFKMHTLSHSGEKSYKCELCGLLLMSGSHLKRHMRVHTGEKRYTCLTCGKKFAERYNLAVHEKLHLGVSKKKYQCHVCDSWFNRKLQLEEHLLTTHQQITDEVDPLA